MLQRSANQHRSPPGDSAQGESPAAEFAVTKRLPTFGVALFDNENDMSAGWGCASNGESFYFTGLNQLANDVVWVTNAEWTEYQQKGSRLHNMRRGDYLKTPINRIALDLGLRCDGQYARSASHALARLVQQSVATAATIYGWQDPAAEIREDVLYDDIRRTLVQPPKSKPHVLPALTASYQGSSSPPWPPNYEEATIALTLRLNRLEYARDLLELTVPDEGWSIQLRGSDVSGSGCTMDNLLDPSHPVMVEATVELNGCDPDLAALVAFGAQSSKRTTLRRWISQPELQWLVRYATVHVHSVIMSVQKRQLPEAVRLPAALTSDPLFSLSVSAGLVAESHFHAVASEFYNRALKRKVVSAWAVWMRAYDRARMFDLSLQAYRRGFTPIAYGGGSMTVKLPKARLPELLAFAQEFGIAHPCLHPYFVEHGFVEAGQPLPF